MDLAVILPLAALLAFQVSFCVAHPAALCVSVCSPLIPHTTLCLQVLVALLLLAPRALSKHVAGLLVLTKTNTVCSTALHTTAVALLAVTVSSLIQLLAIRNTMSAPQYDG